MPKQEIAFQSFSGGEQSPSMYGRSDLKAYKNGCRRVKNFQLQTTGPAQYRPGFRFVNHTRLNQIANLITFEFNDIQSYVLEFTDKKLRFFRDEGFILDTFKRVTGITNANPGVVTPQGSNPFLDGEEVFLKDFEGMMEVNNCTFIVTNATGTTFELFDVDGNGVDTTTFGTFAGAAASINLIYEIDSPYAESDDLFKLKVTQSADTMYIVHPDYEPRKLTRTGHTAWTLNTFARTNDPFTAQQVITGITQANPAVVTIVGHTFVNDDIVIIEGVVGMTEINGLYATVKNVTANTFELQNLDSTAFTAYSSGGYATPKNLVPSAVSFYESRLFYGGQDANPDKFFGSRTPDNTGTARFDDFTNGTNDDDAVEYAIANAEVNKILWMTGTDRLLFTGTFGSEARITGDQIDKPITPTSISVRQLNSVGVADVAPINRQSTVFYVQRGGLTINSLQYDDVKDAYVPTDQNLLSDHITISGIKEMAWITGRPDILYAIRNDGVMIGMTFKDTEQVAGWQRFVTGEDEGDRFASITGQPRPSSYSQLWTVVRRDESDGTARRYVEFLEDVAELPRRVDFFTGTENKAADDAKFGLAMAEAQKGYVHTDATLTYDGSALRAGNCTPGATTGLGVTFTSTGTPFLAADVGKQIWKKAIDGVGTGRATITVFNSTASVDCDIIDDFDNTDVIGGGDWYLATDEFFGAKHLAGRTVSVVTDGGLHPDVTVSSIGKVTLDYHASVIHVGKSYEGFLQPMSLEIGGGSGVSQTKNKHVSQVGIKFFQSLGADFGTDLYKPTFLSPTKMPLIIGDPTLPVTGVEKVQVRGDWEDDLIPYIRQTAPLPCTVQLLAIYGETDDD